MQTFDPMNFVNYQQALAQHAKRDEQIRFLGALGAQNLDVEIFGLGNKRTIRQKEDRGQHDRFDLIDNHVSP